MAVLMVNRSLMMRLQRKVMILWVS